ncbi:MAG TPA: alkaline phosphatase family protein [Elusimicrobiota bacterium]|nr:alkaline phosphatase family protein [Elusimicrobiota bacterium]
MGNDRLPKKIVFIASLATALVASPPGGGAMSAAIPGQQPSVIWIGLDGADPDLLEQWVREGFLPTFSRLMKEGSYGRTDVNIGTTFSPNVWTSIFTGQRPEKHGILFPPGLKDIPSSQRKTKAIWNILSEHDRRVASVGHLVTWPAEPVRGTILSRFYLKAGVPRSIYPDNLYQELLAHWRSQQGAIQKMQDLMDPYRPSSPSQTEFPDDPRGNYLREKQKDLNNLTVSERDAYALATGLYLLENRPFDFFTVYFVGCDYLGHRFARYMPPVDDYVPTEDATRYAHALRDYYIMMDRFIERLLSHAGENTTVVICSDHGTTKKEPLTPDDVRAGKPAGNHVDVGIVLFKGPAIKNGYPIPRSSILDLTPTVLYLLGLPVAGDMDGRVLTDMIRPAYFEDHPVRRVDSFGPPTHIPLDFPLEKVVNPKELDELRSLGYLK